MYAMTLTITFPSKHKRNMREVTAYALGFADAIDANIIGMIDDCIITDTTYECAWSLCQHVVWFARSIGATCSGYVTEL